MEAVHQFQGVTDSTMSHGEGWQFIQVGRYIERATATAIAARGLPRRPLGRARPNIPEGNEYLDWMGLLRSATAFEAYCKVYTADLTPERILEFLLLDAEFPHSLRFSIDTLQHALEAIQARARQVRAEALRRLAGTPPGLALLLLRRRNPRPRRRRLPPHHPAQCRDIHDTIYELYVDYTIQAALAGAST